jgi:hypothetical protein
VPANLPKLLNLLTSASTKWFDLGLQLDIDYTILTNIEQDSHHQTWVCFREMLATWLKITPNPSWENLLAALKEPAVGHVTLAEDLANTTWTEDELKRELIDYDYETRTNQVCMLVEAEATFTQIATIQCLLLAV